jgi:hypothetical protein
MEDYFNWLGPQYYRVKSNVLLRLIKTEVRKQSPLDAHSLRIPDDSESYERTPWPRACGPVTWTLAQRFKLMSARAFPQTCSQVPLRRADVTHPVTSEWCVSLLSL